MNDYLGPSPAPVPHPRGKRRVLISRRAAGGADDLRFIVWFGVAGGEHQDASRATLICGFDICCVLFAASFDSRYYRDNVSDDEDFAPAAVKKAAVKVPSAKKPAKQPKDVGAMYEKLEQLEHVLKRPDTYIGSVQKVTEVRYGNQNVGFDAVEKKLVYRTITFVPGLYKIFDEILVNAADNKQRDQEDGRADKVMTEIKINIDPFIRRKRSSAYPYFRSLLAGSNFNDDEKKTTGGRNGYGAKLCNAFSTKFTLSVASKDDGKTFKQTWTDNMNKVEKEIIKRNSRNEDFTMVEFWPDLKRFDMEKLDDDFVALLSRRAYDLAGTVRVSKFAENVRGVRKDVHLRFEGRPRNPVNVVVEKIGKEGITTEGTRWEVAVCSSTEGQFQQVSFANRIATTKGGRHVDYVTEQIAKVLGEQLKKKNKTGQEIKPAVNPTFDSQTKEALTLQASKFGSKFQISDDFSKKVLKMGVWENILQFQINKQKTKLDRAGGTKTSKLKNIPKLEDANDAGTKHSDKCTLILTEGDSARRWSFPVSVSSGATSTASSPCALLENAEIQNIVKILGLKFNCKYQTKKISRDSAWTPDDHDRSGSGRLPHQGLLINFITTPGRIC
ncbi:DNA topoisomerase 2 [Hypsibius exemplaris]|uniref:DNA topoisomerase 2 n=1 Tax=Hypsibius exemplaris TaxID=2072580 RepID=A0A1W0XCF7_HYPEX|nr:DNA topoisomerase 2 [Hypsibius exemplaris]